EAIDEPRGHRRIARTCLGKRAHGDRGPGLQDGEHLQVAWCETLFLEEREVVSALRGADREVAHESPHVGGEPLLRTGGSTHLSRAIVPWFGSSFNSPDI